MLVRMPSTRDDLTGYTLLVTKLLLILVACNSLQSVSSATTSLPAIFSPTSEAYIDECDTDSDDEDYYECGCAFSGYLDDQCDNDNCTFTETETCNSTGICMYDEEIDGYTCDCGGVIEWDTCPNDIDECDSSPCQHEGTCTDEKDQYTCACVPGYDGDNCENDIDECGSSPCEHDGTCTDGINQYTCDCVSGYEGDNCEFVPSFAGGMSITIEKVYEEALKIPTSEAYKSLEASMIERMTQILTSGMEGIIQVLVLGFREGSVITDLEVKQSIQPSPARLNLLSQVLLTALGPNKELSLNGTTYPTGNFTVFYVRPEDDRTIKVEYYAPCQFYEAIGACQHDSVCEENMAHDEASCVCVRDTTTGEYCEILSPDGEAAHEWLIIMVTVIAAILYFIGVIVLGLLIVMAKRRRDFKNLSLNENKRRQLAFTTANGGTARYKFESKPRDTMSKHNYAQRPV